MSEYEYSIGYVSKFTKLPQSVLRYWETVIEAFNPYKTEGGTRKYSDKDIELVLKIKELLYEKKFTIAGANNFLNSPQKAETNDDMISIPKSHFMQLMYDLELILNNLKSD
ncbi:MAG: MerR family transcriptional regulator [Calditrichia bacterium]|nr:MerR family transcriptional regulator [Calditrichia bacterium]